MAQVDPEIWETSPPTSEACPVTREQTVRETDRERASERSPVGLFAICKREGIGTEASGGLEPAAPRLFRQTKKTGGGGGAPILEVVLL